LDVDRGRVVKGTHFQNLKDAGNPLFLAKYYDEQGADELVFLDITASSDKRAILKDLVQQTASQLFIPFTVGGGISDLDTISELLRAGADKISINTAAIYHPDLIRKAAQQFGSQCIVVAIDVKQMRDLSPMKGVSSEWSISDQSQWEVYTHGGRKRTGIDAQKWALYMQEQGAGELLITSMDKDGTKTGYDIALTKSISESVKIPVIASGGAGSLHHITEVLQVCEAALLASLLHFKELTIAQIKEACFNQNIPVRPI
jgi:cyclase